MTFGRPTSWFTGPSLLGAAAVAALCSLPGQAAASCGDYVLMRGEGHSAIDEVSATAAEESQPSPLQPGPCNGPQCSGRRAPFTPPVSMTPDIRTQPGCVLGSTRPPVPERRTSLVDIGALRPVWRAEGIFHPPRSRA